MLVTPKEKTFKKITRFGLGSFAILVAAFIGTKVYPIIHGPQINIKTVTDGVTLNEPLIELTGRAKYTKDLVVNGTPLATSPDGSFGDNIVLSPGYNVITLAATDRYGKTEVKNYTIVLHETDGDTFTVNVPPYSGGL